MIEDVEEADINYVHQGKSELHSAWSNKKRRFYTR